MVSIYDDLPDVPKGGIFGVGKHLKKKKVKTGLQDTGNAIGKALDDWKSKRTARRKRKKYKFKAQLEQRSNR